MNAERLHAIALALHNEMVSTDIVGKMEKLRASLEEVIKLQGQPSYHQGDARATQQDLVNDRESVYSSLSNTNTDKFSPAWRQLLSEIGGVDLFGETLKNTVKKIFEENQLTPAVALKELEGLKERLEDFQKSLDKILGAFKVFKIGDEKLEPGECEIGMLIPRAAVNNQLVEFTKELDELSFVINTFSEVATGKTDDLRIKTISSTDLSVYLMAAVPFAACLSHAIERIVALYQRLLEIRKLRGELAKQGVPEKQASGIEEYANNIMKDGIEELSVEMMKTFYHGKDIGRKNELTTQTRFSLNCIANRIDRGYNIEVRVESLKEVAQDDNAAKETAEKIQAIQAASKNMQFMKLEGNPILQLPENVEKPRGKEGKKSGSSATEAHPPAPAVEAPRRTRSADD
jgi:hypothetical protein